MPTSRTDIRRQLRHLRRTLPVAQRHRLARALARRLAASKLIRRSRHIAVYLSQDGEMDLGPLVGRLWAMGKDCYLPVLNGPRLWFLPYRPDTPLRRNRFGIPEPDLHPRRRRRPGSLDLVLAPLVAFDGRGNRLGMGGGFYDRTFAYLSLRNHWRRPLMVGVAFAFQRQDALPFHPWDVPLRGAATERGIEWFAGAP